MFVSFVYLTLGLVGGIFTSGQNIPSGEAAVHYASTVTGRNDMDAIATAQWQVDVQRWRGRIHPERRAAA